MNIEETHNKESNSELITREDVPNSPFTIIGLEEGHFIAIGKYRLNEPTSKEECLEWISDINWNKIVQLILILNESTK